MLDKGAWFPAAIEHAATISKEHCLYHLQARGRNPDHELRGDVEPVFGAIEASIGSKCQHDALFIYRLTNGKLRYIYTPANWAYGGGSWTTGDATEEALQQLLADAKKRKLGVLYWHREAIGEFLKELFAKEKA
jgi:hypothetical protein